MNRKAILATLWILTLATDQITKVMVQANLELHETVEVIPGFFNITYLLNPGAAFGIFHNQSPMFRRVFFVIITLMVCVTIIVLLYKEFQSKLRSVAYVLVMSGAIGNLIDRIRIDHVVDFLDFYYKDFHWYTFNIADCYITIGVLLLIISAIEEN